MSYMKYFILISIGAMVLANPIAAYADETFKNRINALEPLILHYGVNSFKARDQDVLITRGAFVSETAWGGDGYTVLVHDGKIWQLARLGEGLQNETTIWSVPHTGEDAITSVYFLMSKKETASALYLLIAHREYKNNPLDRVPAEFKLYVLQRDDDFGIYYFHKLESEKSKAEYCNSDSAAYHELGIPLPDGKEFSCIKQ